MIDTTSATIKALQASVSNKLTEMLDGRVDQYSSVLADEMSVNGSAVTLPIVLPSGKMEEWLDTKKVQSFFVSDFTKSVRDFHKTIKIKATVLEDDQLGLYAPAIANLTKAATNHYNKLVAEVLTSNPLTVTGVALFSDTQSWAGESSTQDNKLALALDETNLATAVAALETFKDQTGETLGRKATHLIVPPQLRATALKLTANISSYGGFNVFGGALQVVVIPELGGAATTWYVADCENGKPIALLNRKAPVATVVDKSVEDGNILVTVDMRAAAVPMLWCNIVQSIG